MGCSAEASQAVLNARWPDAVIHDSHDFDWSAGLTGYCVHCALPSDCLAARQPCRPSTDTSPESLDEIALEARRYG